MKVIEILHNLVVEMEVHGYNLEYCDNGAFTAAFYRVETDPNDMFAMEFIPFLEVDMDGTVHSFFNVDGPRVIRLKEDIWKI